MYGDWLFSMVVRIASVCVGIAVSYPQCAEGGPQSNPLYALYPGRPWAHQFLRVPRGKNMVVDSLCVPSQSRKKTILERYRYLWLIRGNTHICRGKTQKKSGFHIYCVSPHFCICGAHTHTRTLLALRSLGWAWRKMGSVYIPLTHIKMCWWWYPRFFLAFFSRYRYHYFFHFEYCGVAWVVTWNRLYDSDITAPGKIWKPGKNTHEEAPRFLEFPWYI